MLSHADAAEELRENAEQWQAYEAEKDCVVVAGPGSGKTKTLTIKIARMLDEDVSDPRGLACITFSNECVRELRTRLEKLEIVHPRRLFVGTVHSFCLRYVIEPFARLALPGFPMPIGIAEDGDKRRALTKALVEKGINEKPENWSKRVEKHRRLNVDRSGAAWKATQPLSAIAEIYEGSLAAEGLVDFDSIALNALWLIQKHGWIRDVIRAKFPIVAIDEYQDLGVALHQMILALRTHGVRVFAVGDPDQSVYGFNGAKPELLNELAQMPGMERVELKFNYRCATEIVAGSLAVLGQPRPYISISGEEGLIELHKCPNGFEEQIATAFDLAAASLLRRKGRKLGDVAIIYQDRYEGDRVADVAAERVVPVIRLDQGAAYERTPLTRWIEECAVWGSVGWMKGKPRLSALLARWNQIARLDRLSEIERRQEASVLVRFLWGNRSASMGFAAWLTGLDTAIVRRRLSEEMLREERRPFEALLKSAAPGGAYGDATLAVFAGQGGDPSYLRLYTFHKAKGLEFDVVIMIGLDDGKMPRWDADEDARREARRAFYVGLTRARHEVHLVYSGFTVNQYGKEFRRGPSPFLLEVQQRARS
jgi:DNA helicase II / ATP-dependent DNA helicase PcrA